MDIPSFLSSISISGLGFNWIDLLIVVIIGFYAIEGYSLGFFVALVDLLSFVLSFIFGLFLYFYVGKFLFTFLSIPQGFANAIGFFAIAVIFEIIFSFFLRLLIKNVTFFEANGQKDKFMNSLNSFLGIIPGVLSAIVLISFVLSLIVSLPLSVFLKRSVSESKIGNVLVANTQGFGRDINNVFGGAVNDSLSFLTVEPKSDTSVELNFKTSKINVDYQAEQKMFSMVNSERISRGIHALKFSEDLAKVGRAHCKDMFIRGYFSHYTPEGLSPFDRMAQADIVFNYAGENLALAPNTDLAMKGLMQSTGHRENILSANFNKVGIGVIDGGIYGEMYCQEFTD